MKEAKSKALKAKMEDKKECKKCGSMKHGSADHAKTAGDIEKDEDK